MHTVCVIIKPSGSGTFVLSPIEVLFVDYNNILFPATITIHKSFIISVFSGRREDAISKFENIYPEFKDYNLKVYNKLAIEEQVRSELRKLGIGSRIDDGKVELSIVDVLKLINIKASLPERYMKLRGDFSTQEEKKRVDESIRKTFRLRGKSS